MCVLKSISLPDDYFKSTTIYGKIGETALCKFISMLEPSFYLFSEPGYETNIFGEEN